VNKGSIKMELSHTLSKSHNVLDQISKLMESDDFRSFFRENFDEWSNITTVIMCMKLYDIVDQYYQHRSNGPEKLSPEQITEVVKNALKNSEIRRVLVDQMSNFTKGIESGFSKKYLENGYLDLEKAITYTTN
jgi:hypothetical protein